MRSRISAPIAIVAALVLRSSLAGDLPRTIRGKVVAIADGDTLTVLDAQNVQHKIRLAGIDAPEKRQPFGARSKENLAALCFGKTVSVHVSGLDRYRREVGRVFDGAVLVNLEQVRAGMAWDYPRYDSKREFAAAESQAKGGRRGLWADKDPEPPWEFRRRRREGR